MTNGVEIAEVATFSNLMANFRPDTFLGYIKVLLLKYGINILIAIIILIVGKIVVKVICDLVKKSLAKSSKLDEMLVNFISNILNALLMTFVFIGALGQLGVQTASLVAVLGACVLAVGLALQGSLSNFASGVLIIILKPFKVGDFIEAAGTSGSVQEVNIFTTELCSPDNKKITIPNSPIMSNSIINYSHHPTRRVEVIASVSYDDDMDKVRELLNGLIKKSELILDDPEPAIVLKTLNDSSVDFSLRLWVNTADYWTVLFDMQEQIKRTFDANDISIPFPQRDVHLCKTE
ncbi:MAG: mechanosensitive ion channel [Kiritimatiellae bacterium]|jgi:small conductance mechanosensitive channel|nr:mechanosensitive ion channel [Kiritimatiellia bacterium]